MLYVGREILHQASLCHPFIIQLFEVFLTPRHLAMCDPPLPPAALGLVADLRRVGGSAAAAGMLALQRLATVWTRAYSGTVGGAAWERRYTWEGSAPRCGSTEGTFESVTGLTVICKACAASVARLQTAAAAALHAAHATRPPHARIRPCSVMEYADLGNLLAYQQAQPGRRLAESTARWLFQQLVIGLDYAHQRVGDVARLGVVC